MFDTWYILILYASIIRGLADGAGGNRSLGINPADFSRAILAACRQILRQTPIQSNQLPRLILAAMEQVEERQIRGKKEKKKKPCISFVIGYVRVY
jgi:hypothetical protein